MSSCVTLDYSTLLETTRNAERLLIAAADPQGCWEGELCSSALATAVAVSALWHVDREQYRTPIESGLRWLSENANPDGGWGDTTDSASNLSTTLLCRTALAIYDGESGGHQATMTAANDWVRARTGELSPGSIADSVLSHYGNDRTFSAPILTLCALGGSLGKAPDCWRLVPQLPFELAILPRRLFRILRLDVVSYAIPALIAIGLVRHRALPASDRLREWIRNRCTPRALRLLESMQPASGGFLEATPLTGFVAMSLAAGGLKDFSVTRHAAGFLAGSMRADGSWPIDTNLSTWVTTLSVNALGNAMPRDGLGPRIKRWLLDQQVKERHPFTQSAPGGWAWTDLSGGVPDGDDTAGALLALKTLGGDDVESLGVGLRGVEWLLGLQNRDGGTPAFCRGWGHLPFDRSCPDITAHALVALDAWYDDSDGRLRSLMDFSMERAVQYLDDVQQEDGSWLPLWFGNESGSDGGNPAFGTGQVVHALRSLSPGRLPDLDALIHSGAGWLLQAQDRSGGWGGAPGVAPSIEETAKAVLALAGLQGAYHAAAERGAQWLVEKTEHGTVFPAAPIGLYFASLWYSERLYPVVFAVRALRAVLAAGAGHGRVSS